MRSRLARLKQMMVRLAYDSDNYLNRLLPTSHYAPALNLAYSNQTTESSYWLHYLYSNYTDDWSN